MSSFIDELKGEIEKFQAKNPGKEFVLDIVPSEVLEITDTDNTILIPDLSEFNIVINVNGNIITNGKQLILKLNQKAATRSEPVEGMTNNFSNKITLNLKNDDIDLILDVPGTEVTVNNLNSIQILNGVSMVKDGASVNTYVWAPTTKDRVLNNGEPEWVPVTLTIEGSTIDTYMPNVRYEKDGTVYIFKNMKIVKGQADYARIVVVDEKRTLNKLTVAEGATVLLNNNPYIKEIVGEGNAKIMFDNWWVNQDDKDTKTYVNQGSLYNIQKLNNVTIEAYFATGAEYNNSHSSIYDVPVDIENVIFKVDEVGFTTPNTASAAVKNCQFVGSATNQRVSVVIPGQTEAINAFKFNFDNCEFNENVGFNTSINTSKPKVDKDGNVIIEDRYEWYVYENDIWNWKTSNNEADIPEAIKAAGVLNSYDWVYNETTKEYEPQKGYWKYKATVYEEITFKDFYATVAFKACKYAGETMTVKQFRIQNAWMPQGAYLRFEFDGKTYRALWDAENQTYILIEA